MAIRKAQRSRPRLKRSRPRSTSSRHGFKELEQKKLEAENSEIVEIVRGMSISLADLPLVLQQLQGGVELLWVTVARSRQNRRR